MKRYINKLYLLTIAILVNIVLLTACTNYNFTKVKEEKSVHSIEITENNAKAISVGNSEIVNIVKSDKNKIDTSTRIENKANFDISKIWIEYEEFDKNKNIIDKSESLLDMTLNPGESAYIVFGHKEYTDSLKVVGYRYEAEGKEVLVNTKNDDIEIKEKTLKLESSKDYEILVTSDIYKLSESEDGITYGVKVKNSSNKSLGNIILKIGELNEDGEYIMVSHISEYSVLKPSQEVEIETVTSQAAKKIEILGYNYDDVKEKASIDIDLKTHKASINK
ncbi:hypothetical protein [Clostridium sp. CCUG 7971]|uniref:hypothetical protein n=1 Tax=Clostridium sp. CCUG 7971 TaxID=2811414 RepID=UPI001ABB963D|nr:hypothetical protein [Clostridium sp. CCUG 7971]MBO3442933.1 hypothetical protein [Clostridium sp. CCUG 7971]